MIPQNPKLQVIVVAPKGAQPPPGPASSHGLTPPMRDARRRHFRQRIEAPPHVVTRVEADLLAIIRVRGWLGSYCKPFYCRSA